MDATEKAVLCIVRSSRNNTLQGRTLLQKAIYFLNETMDLGIRYRPHYFGPFSEDVANTIASLVAVGALREMVECLPASSDPFDGCRYTYILTELGRLMLEQEPDGDLESACREILGETDDYSELAAAAKLHHIIKRHGGDFSYEAVMANAHDLGWKLQPRQIENAARLLVRLLRKGHLKAAS